MQERNSSVKSLSSQPNLSKSDLRKSVLAELAPGRVRGNLSSFPRTRGQARKRLKRAKAKQRRSALPPSGVQGAQPPPGVQRVPLYPKTLEGGPVGQRRRPSQSPR